MLKIKDSIAPEIIDESCVIVALLLDLGKAGMPGNPQYLKVRVNIHITFMQIWDI